LFSGSGLVTWVRGLILGVWYNILH
jgi:hypothetical protein